MRCFLLSFLCLPALAATPALAQQPADTEPPPVRIETDQTRKSFVFIIDGEPVALLDKSGLIVTGDIAYGGTLADTGPGAAKDRPNAAAGTEADDE